MPDVEVPGQCQAIRELWPDDGPDSIPDGPVYLECGRDVGHDGPHRDQAYQLLWADERPAE